jgi:uncharacterized metal-binding protein
MSESLPLLFACAGCSQAGRLAYDVAQELDRRGIAKMSCLAGVGARKPHFLKQLHDRELWAIDGCPIECSLGVFEHVNKNVDVHIQLFDLGIRKNSSELRAVDLNQVVHTIVEQVANRQAANSQIE